MSHASKLSRVGRLPRWQRRATYIVFLACALSGLVYFCLSELHWGESLLQGHDVLALHGISTYFVLLAFGGVLPVHIRAAWKVGRNKTSGVIMIAILGVLMLSGLGLYYGSEEMRDFVLWAHWIAGGIILLAFPAHLFVGKMLSHHATAASSAKLVHKR